MYVAVFVNNKKFIYLSTRTHISKNWEVIPGTNWFKGMYRLNKINRSELIALAFENIFESDKGTWLPLVFYKSRQ